jgi:hypothetical protein
MSRFPILYCHIKFSGGFGSLPFHQLFNYSIMANKFSVFDKVIVSGSATGFGDQDGIVEDSKLVSITNRWYYQVSLLNPHPSQDPGIFVAEIFLTLNKK